MALTQEQADNNRIDPTRKKKPSNAELMAQQAAAAQQEPAPAINTYMETTEEQASEKKKLVSFYCNEAIYEQLATLARYRSLMSGIKNSRGQNIGAGTLINQAATEYVEAHADELRKWKALEGELMGKLDD